MASTRPIRELIGVARAHARALPDESRLSFPMPLTASPSADLAFLYCASRIRPREGCVLFSPTYRILANLATGRFVELDEVSSSDFGQPEPKGGRLGPINLAPGMTSENYLAKQERLYDLYDRLLPALSVNPRQGPEALRKDAKEFIEVFRQLAEPPLLPYYRSAGKPFFDWLETAAGEKI